MSSSRPSAPPAEPAAGRGTSLPVLSGVRVRAHRRPAAPHRHRPRAHDLGRGRRVGRRPTASWSCPAGWPPTSCGRCPTGACRWRSPTTRPGSRRLGRSSASACSPPTSSRGSPRPPGDPVTLAGAELAAALTQVVRAASSDDARPILTGVLLAAEAGGLRLVATDSYRLAIRDLPGTTVLSEGQHVLVPSRALQELARVLTGDEELSVRLGEREASFEVGGTRLTTVLIEGEFPPYERLIPQAQPNRLTVGREVLLEAVRRVKLLAREATPVRLAMSNDGPRAGGGHPGRRPGPREPRRQVRGHRPHRRLQPRVPRAGHRGRPRRRGHHRDGRRPQAGPAAGPGAPGVPLPPDARPRVVARARLRTSHASR